MRPRRAARLVAVLVAMLACPATRAFAAGDAEAAKRPPVVIVVFDALRPDHLGCYGYRKRPTSPTFDRLAAQSYVLDDARAPAPYTLASVATILTGRAPEEHTLTSFERALPASVPTAPALLAPAGYRSAVASRSGILRGFGLEDAFERKFVDPKLTEDVRGFRRAWKAALAEVAESGAPWFAYLHFFPPHAPYRPPRAFTVPFPIPDAPGVNGSIAFLQALDRGEVKLDAAGRDALLARYDANVRHADHELEDLVEHLDALGVLERGWLVVTSDHGEAFGEHGRYEHNSTVYDEMLRVPLLVRPPGGLAESFRIGQAVGLVDLLPTVLAWSGTPAPAELTGVPLPLARGARYAARPRPLSARSASPPERFAITDGDWKYVRALADADPASEELYDLNADPGERVNLASGAEGHLEAMRGAAERELARQRAAAAAPRAVGDLDSNVAESLRALGYVK